MNQRTKHNQFGISKDESIYLIINTCLENNVTSYQQIAYVLATAQHESTNFTNAEEIDGRNQARKLSYIGGANLWVDPKNWGKNKAGCSEQRISSFIIFFCLMFFCFCAQSQTINTESKDNISAEYKNIANQVMDAQYGKKSFDAKLKCWKYTYNYIFDKENEPINYCLDISQIHLVNSRNGRKLLYILANGDKQAILGNDYAYAHFQPGLLGAFVVEIADKNKWTLTSSIKDYACGTFGASNSDVAKFEKIGSGEKFAWVFESGGTWGGNTSAFYSILSVRGNLIDDLSKTIPSITENDQQHEFSIQFIKSNKDYYDLKVKKLKANTNIVVHSYIVPFNKKLYGYKMPKGSVKWTYIYF